MASNKAMPTVNIHNPAVFQQLKSIGKTHYAVVQVILANAPNIKAAQVWAKFEDRIKIGATNTKGSAYHKEGVLYFDITEIAKGDVINKPYQILFHEGAHNIDFLASEEGKRFSEIYKGGAFLKTIDFEFKELLSSFQSYEKLRKEWRKYTRIERAALSDILSGYTDNKVSLGIGHNAEYWTAGGESIKSREAFADFFDAAIANESAYKLLQKYLPKTEVIFEEMLDELLK